MFDSNRRFMAVLVAAGLVAAAAQASEPARAGPDEARRWMIDLGSGQQPGLWHPGSAEFPFLAAAPDDPGGREPRLEPPRGRGGRRGRLEPPGGPGGRGMRLEPPRGRGGRDRPALVGPGPPGPGPIGGPPGQGRFGRHRWMPAEDQIDEGMAFLKKHWPERHAMMDQLRTEDPEAFELAFRNLWPRLTRVIELSRRNPALAEVEVGLVRMESKLLRTARAYHALVRPRGPGGPDRPAESEEPQGRRKELLAEFEDLVGQRFDLEIKRAELRIQELTEELAQQRQRLEARRENKQDEVDQIVKRLTSRPGMQMRHRGFRGRGSGRLQDGRGTRPGLGPGGIEPFRRGPRRMGAPPASRPAD